MSEQLVVPTNASLEVSLHSVRTSQGQRWFELVLLLSIAIGPSIFGIPQMLKSGQVGLGSANWSLLVFHEITSLLLLGYILWRRKLRLAHLGLRWTLRDLARGVGLIVVSYCVYTVGFFIVHAIHRAIFGEIHSGMTAQAIFGHFSIAAAIPLILVNPFFEELIVRAYLITEVRELTGSAALAAALSVAVQTAYHLYYGWQGALSLAFLFLAFAVYYARSRRAVPIVLAHGAFDLWGLLRLW